jgi:uncharacterized protein
MSESVWKLTLGLLTGVTFGFLLQKGWVAKQRVIVGAFLLRDFTAIKVLLTAAAVGSVGVWGLHALGVGELQPKPMMVGGIVGGGILFGVGIVLFGYCPGTSIAASGEGHRDAKVGVLGMLVGAGAYVLTYPALEPVIKDFGNWGKATLPSVSEVSPLIWVPVFATITLGVLAAGEKYSRARLQSEPIKPSERYPDSAA